jgi:quinol monooxygenase YgiN
MISVVAVLTAKPGEAPALLAAVQANLEAVRAEAGCIEYGPAQDAPFSPAKFGEDCVIVLEKWASAEALAAHGKAPHMAAFSASIRDILAGRPSIHILAPA